jgi:hypothetical protein
VATRNLRRSPRASTAALSDDKDQFDEVDWLHAVTQRQHDGSRVIEEHAQNGLPVLEAIHRGMPGQPSGGRLEAIEESCLALPRTSRAERGSSVDCGCTHGRYGSSASDRLTTENDGPCG